MYFRSRRFLAACTIALLAACTPRQPMVVAPAPAPPPPPPPAVTEAEANVARDLEARRFWEQGTAQGRRGAWSQAADSYRRAAEIRPDSVVYHMALSTALVQQGRAWEAADAMQAGIRVAEARQPVNHRLLAVDYDRLIELLTRLNRQDEARAARERQRFHRMMRDSSPPE
jgi:tetratricopeptide (TPR) repeat protein